MFEKRIDTLIHWLFFRGVDRARITQTMDNFWDQAFFFWYTHSATPAVHADGFGYFVKGSTLMPSILDHLWRHNCVLKLRYLGSSLVRRLLHIPA